MPKEDTQYKNKFADEDILALMSPVVPIAIAEIAKELGCVKNTANAYLRDMEKRGLIKKLHITGGSFGWLLATPMFEDVVNEEGMVKVGKKYQGKKVKIIILEG
jgi:predicted DNA-binding transcriptional regulator